MAILETPVGAEGTVETASDAPLWQRFGRDIPIGWGTLVAAVLGVYLVVNLFTSPDGHLLADPGGKAASLEAMRQRGDWNPDIGYWFQDVDSEGRFFPLERTSRTANGDFVNTTSLTMVLAAKPLYDIGGPSLAVLIPLLGGLATAVAAAALERRLDPLSDGKWSFLLVGLSSSVVVYTTDLWEHTLALAATTFCVVKVLDAVNQKQTLVSALYAGLAIGLAITMRQEALIYGFVAGVVLVVVLTARAGTRSSIPAGLAMMSGVGFPIALHTGLELVLLGGAARVERSIETAGVAGSGPLSRLDGAATTTVNLLSGPDPLSAIAGIVLLGLGAHIVRSGFSGEWPERSVRLFGVLLASALIVHAVRQSPVSAVFIATPLMLVGVIAGVRNKRWVLVALGAAPIPLVLLTQFPNFHQYQWGGRYLLGSAVVFTVLAVVHTRQQNTRIFATFVVATIAITAYAIPYSVLRINGVSEDRAAVEQLTEVDEVVVWRSGSTARDLGQLSVSRQWLSASQIADQRALASVFERQSIDSFVLIVDKAHPGVQFPGFERVATRGELEYFGHWIEVWAATN